MSSTLPTCDEEVDESSPFGGAECEESSPEHQTPVADEQEEHLYPFDSLAVEYNEGTDEASGSKGVEDGLVYAETANSLSQDLDENTNASQAFESDAQGEAELTHPDYREIQKSYFEDYMYSNNSSFDEGSNSNNFDDTREEPKGTPLCRFAKIAKAVEIAEYGTLQVLYQLLYQRSAWDTQEILSQRILDFSGFNFNEKSEDFFNREMMLRTQPGEMLVKLGAILGLPQIQKMLFDMDNGRAELISAIMNFLSRPNRRSNIGVKCDDILKTPTKCGCRSRCPRRFSQVERSRLLDYTKELEGKGLLDNYLFSLMECTKIIRGPSVTARKLKEVNYQYKCKFGRKEVIVCKGAFMSLHGVKVAKLNALQLKLKAGNVPPFKLEDFPPITTQIDFVQKVTPEPSRKIALDSKTVQKVTPEPSISRKMALDSKTGKKTWMSSEEQVRKLDEEVTKSIQSLKIPKVVLEKCDAPKASTEHKNTKNENSSDSKGNEEESSASKKLKDFPLVVTAIECSPEELLLDVHFLLFLNSADADQVKENILEFDGFSFDDDSEEYDERYEFLQRMSPKLVSEVARSFSLEILKTKAATIKNILTFLTKPNESFLSITSSMPLSLSDVELDDIGDMSDSDVSITCEVVEKKVECIDILSSGEDSDREDKPRKEKKSTPQKTAPVVKQAVAPSPVVKPIVLQVQKPQVTPSPPVASTSQSQSSPSPGGKRYLRNFETICKIVNTHPHEYLIDIHELLYLKKHDPNTLRDDILNFSGFDFEKSSPEYVKRKQLLDRMLYNSVRRIYNTLIHNTTEVKVFSKPTMITEIFQFLFNLPPNDTSVRPNLLLTQKSKPIAPAPPAPKIVPPVAPVLPPGGPVLPNQTGKLSDLKRVFQRVACFPCEYLVDVHKLLFMTDCDSKVIRNNIFAFKGFDFASNSQEFQQRKMYLEYLTFHSLRKISSVLTTRSVDLRNSTKHELATHLTQVLAEYCTDHCNPDPEANTQDNSQDSQSDVTSSSTAVENIVVTPIIDPSFANPPSDMEVYNVSNVTTNIANNPSVSQTGRTAPRLAISIVDARSINSPSISTTTNSSGRRKSVPAKVRSKTPQQEQSQPNVLHSQNISIYPTNVPTIAISGTTIYPQQVQPNQIIGLSQNIGTAIISHVPSTNSEIIVPGVVDNSDEAPPSKKAKLSSPKDGKSVHNNIRDAITSDDEDCDKPLSSLVGHPIDSVLKKNIVDIVEESDLASITINGVIQKIFGMYPKFDLSYRKEFIKSTLRSMLYRLGEQKKSDVTDKRETNSPDCSVTTTEDCDSGSVESPKSAMECS